MSKKRGFTLIELLVVVLIIGILVVVAGTQYQKSVAKARGMEAITALKSITEAQEAYYLSNMQYANELDLLDVTVQNPGKYYRYTCTHRSCFAWPLPLYAGAPGFEFHMQQKVTGAEQEFLGKHWCLAHRASDPEKARSICLSFGPEDPDMPGYYLIR